MAKHRRWGQLDLVHKLYQSQVTKPRALTKIALILKGLPPSHHLIGKSHSITFSKGSFATHQSFSRSLFVRAHKFLFGEIMLSSFFKRVTSDQRTETEKDRAPSRKTEKLQQTIQTGQQKYSRSTSADSQQKNSTK